MSICVGDVIAVRGTQVTLRIYEESSLETMYFDGKKYKGVSIREFIGIKRGFSLIVCIVEGEYLDEKRFEVDDDKVQYIRKVEAKPIGYFESKRFTEGVKLMPMIRDKAFLLNEQEVTDVFSQGNDGTFTIGKLLKEDLPVSLPWDKLFNSHIGIFGNTGSGKSNTLTNLYSTLFNQYEAKMKGKSQFLLIDFNGEYTGEQLIKDKKNKNTFVLSTGKKVGDQLPLSAEQVWNTEILALLFQATANTQTPFINRVVEKRKAQIKDNSTLKDYVIGTFYLCFVSTSPNRDSLVHLKVIAKHLKHAPLIQKLNKIIWFNKDVDKAKYADPTTNPWEFYSAKEDFDAHIRPILVGIDESKFDSFDELIIRINLQLLRDLLYGNIQFEHIQPLLKRVESAVSDLRKIFEVKDDVNNEFSLLNVVSLRSCNQLTKKIVPLLLAKMFYQEHRENAGKSIENTLHFIIDEAHNILSQQSNREHEVWKDYRLEMFEEIIKEGRKFGLYLTLSSQRPADISPTIMSQLHNFFIHRLVNDKDLMLIDNTISTLDKMSKSLIPDLSKGACVVTGTAFDLPLLMQVDYIENKSSRPDSDDVDLVKLWG
ncbi:ATP-binding protein [uncultured Pseudoalteromonas sp.]|uniref:ATP-binding protein n=1 Tax=uncultured Pseudoalteromonas sp. TaxID=114053 RepID=UPI000C55A8E2|nr:ATP-binding protein [uncultured Pseudoalteromonas sp.]MBD55960.1 nucleotidyltransferase [Pseudoalteromonas sp.]|tara:strand:+ start:18142 stop:19929 length:1788 start_codon:yes stop_codon:yes gene_type:complete